MKDIPIWARWNGQEVLGIIRGERGWHTYYLRKRLPNRPFPLLEAGLNALAQGFFRLPALVGKPWRRLAALRRLS